MMMMIVDRCELQQCCKTNVFKHFYFVFCVQLCLHSFCNMVEFSLYDLQTDEAALGFLRIGASSHTFCVFLLMMWADIFQLKLIILSLSHRSCSLSRRICFSRRLLMYLCTYL
jgi:hypothetical protein